MINEAIPSKADKCLMLLRQITCQLGYRSGWKGVDEHSTFDLEVLRLRSNRVGLVKRIVCMDFGVSKSDSDSR
jgi:hypothetical protein